MGRRSKYSSDGQRLKNEKYRRLSDIEREMLTPEQARKLDNFDRQQEREQQNWEDLTVPGSDKIDWLLSNYSREYANIEDELAQIGDRPDLTEDEKALAAAIAAGYTHREIAAATGIARQTVTDRIQRLKRKMKKNEAI